MGRSRCGWSAGHRWLHSGGARTARPRRPAQQCAQSKRSRRNRSSARSAAPVRARQRLQRVAAQRHALPGERHAPAALHDRRGLEARTQERWACASMAPTSATGRPSPASPTCPPLPIPRAITAAAKRPTKYSFVPVNELGAAAHWSQPLGAGLLLLAGADVHDVRVWDGEQSFTGSATDRRARSSARLRRLRRDHVGAPRVDADRCRPPGLVPELRWPAVPVDRLRRGRRAQRSRRSSASGSSIRGWAWRANWASTGRLPHRDFAPFARPAPASFTAPRKWATSLPSPTASLLSERATGWETGVASQRRWGTVRASYFLTQVNRPITAVTINPNSSPILLHARESRPDREPRCFS